jgi:hypothetical protein
MRLAHVQIVLSVKRVDTSSTSGALSALAAAREELPDVDPPASMPVRSWREELEETVRVHTCREHMSK